MSHDRKIKRMINDMGMQVAMLRPKQPEYVKLIHIIEQDYYTQRGWVSAIKFYQSQIEKWQALLETAEAAEEYGNVYPILDDSLGD